MKSIWQANKRPAKKRKDIFFPESSTSTPIVIHNIGGASPIVSGGEELLAHPLLSRVPNEDRTKLKTLLDRFAITQSNSQSNGSNTFFYYFISRHTHINYILSLLPFNLFKNWPSYLLT